MVLKTIVVNTGYIALYLYYFRNLSFDVEEDALYTFFSQFGPLEFAKIVKDPATQHSRGTAFVKFVNAEDASNVLQQSDKPEVSWKRLCFIDKLLFTILHFIRNILNSIIQRTYFYLERSSIFFGKPNFKNNNCCF